MGSGEQQQAQGASAGLAQYRAEEFDLDLSKPHPARLYDYFLGGKTNYAVDREGAAKVIQEFPNIQLAARYNRSFMHRATRLVAEQHGIDQFLDIGTGIPTEPNLHQIAQRSLPGSRVVYVDHDRIVLAYARALLQSAEEGSTAYVQADLREPARILAEARKLLDFDRPICLSLIAILHFLADEEEPFALVRQLLDELPPGSALMLSHGTEDFGTEMMRRTREIYAERGMVVALRSMAEGEAFFTGAGFELVAPGAAPTCDWHPELEPGGMGQLPGMVTADDVGVWGAVGIKR